MYSSGIDNSVMNRESLRQMAMAQAFGSPCYASSTKERGTLRSLAQRSMSPRRYASPTGPVNAYVPYTSMPSSQVSHQTVEAGALSYPSMLHPESTALPPSSYWYDQEGAWSHSEMQMWKSMAHENQANMSQGNY